ncbi:hypothetical protein F2Q68_00034114 [Brassica cretica]|uniref:Uncharacterized protein n=1 Tax=Brassica cretica TaxID=69181 RepID=A0A8S9H539_BRACR|nr:hypothetical protein F2Q68_00034114 [Brassica cretica]
MEIFMVGSDRPMRSYALGKQRLCRTRKRPPLRLCRMLGSIDTIYQALRNSFSIRNLERIVTGYVRILKSPSDIKCAAVDHFEVFLNGIQQAEGVVAGTRPGVLPSGDPGLPLIARFRHRTRGITSALKLTGVVHPLQAFPRQDIAPVILLSRVPLRPEPHSDPVGGPVP